MLGAHPAPETRRTGPPRAPAAPSNRRRPAAPTDSVSAARRAPRSFLEKVEPGSGLEALGSRRPRPAAPPPQRLLAAPAPPRPRRLTRGLAGVDPVGVGQAGDGEDVRGQEEAS